MAKSKVISVGVNYGETVNMGNYESLRLDYSVQCSINEDDVPMEILHKIKDQLKREVKKAIDLEFKER